MAQEKNLKDGKPHDAQHSHFHSRWVYTLGQYFFPKVLPHIHQVLPDLSLAIVEDFTDTLIPQLSDGSLDMLLLATPLQRTGLAQRALCEERLVWVVASDHPLACHPTLTPEQLGNTPLLVLDIQHCLRNQLMSIFPTSAYEGINVKTIGTSVETIKQMVASGYGISILPEMAINKNSLGGMLKTIAIPLATAKRRLFASWRVSYPRPDLIEHLLTAVGQVLKHEPDK